MIRHENFSVREPLLLAGVVLSVLGFACSGGQGFTAKGPDVDGSDADLGTPGDDGGVVVVVGPQGDGAAHPLNPPADAATSVAVTMDSGDGQKAQDATFDSPPSCPSSELSCGGACVPNDTSHCGACGASCATPDGGSATCVESKRAYACGVACGGNLIACGNACVDVQTDPDNCGRCGHSCVAGACSLGQCQSWVVANTSASHAGLLVARAGTVGHVDLATDGASVVWVDAYQGVLQVSATTGPSATTKNLAPLQYSTTVSAANLAIASGIVVWTVADANNGVSLWKATMGTANSGELVASLGSGSAGDAPSGLALDATGANAYFLDSATGSSSSIPHSPGVYKCTLASQWCSLLYAATPPVVVTLSNDVATMGSRLFWTDSAAGTLQHADYSNNAMGAAVSNQNGPCLLALDATNVYWADVMLNGADGGGSPSFSIAATPQANPGAVTPVVSMSGTLQDMGTDGTNLYFIDNAPGGPDGQLEYAPVGGGSAPRVLKPDQTALGLTVGGGAVYWLNGDDTIDGIAAP
jgi:hypothetical protein